MFYVYVLRSKINGDIYIGFTEDLKNRVKLHNSKRIKSTKRYAPRELIYYEAFKSKKDATRREKELKLHVAKVDLKNKLRYSLK